MPLDEEGAKWSCEPCIRGHRSSKCQHFDRLMMKVPKAGRPLAKCPHPKGSCSCQRTFSMMIRIPKGTGCVCRPVGYDNSSRDQSPSQTANSAASSTTPSAANSNSTRLAQSAHTPLSSMASSPVSCKIQKSGRRQGSIQAVPENIARALDSMPTNLKIEDNVTDKQHQLLSYPLEYNGANMDANVANSYKPMQSLSEVPHNPQKANGSSCCSKKPSPPPAVPKGGGSCCSGKAASQPTAPLVSNLPAVHQQHQQQQTSAWNNASYGNFTPNQMAWSNSIASPSAQPPSNGQFMRPYGLQEGHMTPAYMQNYSQNGNSQSYSHPINGLGIAQSSMSSYTSTPSQNSVYSPTHMGGDASHDCQCGEECQCLGCASHPFNNTTRQHVQEMGEMMTIGGDKPSFDTFQSPTFRGTQNWEQFNYVPQRLEHGIQQQNTFDPYSDQSHATSNANFAGAYSSHVPVGPVLNQQLMHPSEYYTLEYPVGIPSACSDVTGSCQCGNDCSCVGCLTHSGHNGMPLETPLQEPAFTTHHSPDHLVSSNEQVHTTNASIQTSRIPVLENISVPCLSPRTLETSMI